MRLKYQYEMVELEDHIIAIPIINGSEQPNQIMRLNKESKVILSLLLQGLTEDQIVHSIVSEYDTDEHTITGYVNRFIKTLTDAGHIIE